MLPTFRLACFRFDLQALATLRLPRFKGSTLRGGFGHLFKKSVCIQPEHATCAPCLLRQTCPFPTLFESSPPPGAAVLRLNEAIPQPFVIEPPLDERTTIPAGEQLSFTLVLVGRAINFLPYFIIAFRELGKAGLGHPTAKFELGRVTAVQPLTGETRQLYEGSRLLVQTGLGPLEVTDEMVMAHASRLPRDQLSVRFASPTRLKHANDFVNRVEFHVLIRALLRRISSLSYFHCGQQWAADYQGLIAQAEYVHLRESRTEWVSWDRYSTRQERRMELGGVMGEAVYKGDLEPFLSLLALGEMIHVGKATVFGNGLYRLESSQTTAPGSHSALESAPMSREAVR